MSKAIYAEILTIGRDADISLPDSEVTVSRVHCELIIAEDGFFISDLNSQNGLFLEDDGQLIAIRQAWVSLE